MPLLVAHTTLLEISCSCSFAYADFGTYVTSHKYIYIFMRCNLQFTGPRSAVGNMSGYRCVPDCNSRGREFDPGPVPYFVEIDHEIISTVILLPSSDSFKKGCCQLQAKVCAQITGYPLVQACPGESVVR